MKKILKHWGNSLIIILSKEDKKIYNLKEGDIVDIEMVKLKSNKNEKTN
jgi:hypothetical protein